VQLLQEKDGLQAQFGKLAMVVDDRKVSPQKLIERLIDRSMDF
jgi:hypothetical protein